MPLAEVNAMTDDDWLQAATHAKWIEQRDEHVIAQAILNAVECMFGR
jgi:cation transport ATPase